MKLTVKNGVCMEINPFTDAAKKRAYAKNIVKYKAYEADGETPFPDTKEIDSLEFTKVFRAGLQRSVLIHKGDQIPESILLTVPELESIIRTVYIHGHVSDYDNDYPAEMIEGIRKKNLGSVTRSVRS